SAVTFFNDATRGRGTYETCFQNNDDPTQGRHEKVLYAIGKIYQPASASFPSAVKRIKIILTGEASGDFSIIAGPGSLVGNNQGNVASGGVYVNGTITLTNSASIGSPG